MNAARRCCASSYDARSLRGSSRTYHRARLAWKRAPARVFGVEIEQCARCGGRLRVIASIEEPELIERILAHRRRQGGEEARTGEEAMTVSLGARAPPQASLL